MQSSPERQEFGPVRRTMSASADSTINQIKAPNITEKNYCLLFGFAAQNDERDQKEAVSYSWQFRLPPLNIYWHRHYVSH